MRALRMAGTVVAGMAALFGLGGCILFHYGYANTLRMDPRIHALDGLNTPYDDFNAMPPPPPLHMEALLVFASNAESEGRRFQIDAGTLRLTQKPFHSRRDKRPPPPVIETARTGRFGWIPDLPHNHRGPTALVSTSHPRRAYQPPPEWTHHWALSVDTDRQPLAGDTDERLEQIVWMFDSDMEGRRNLYFIDSTGEPQAFFGNDPDADDAYATYDFERHELFFCSNRSGRYEMYRYRNSAQDTRFAEWLGDAGRAGRIERVETFSADGDSLAPFIEGDVLVFASNRSGGRGGFDLYVSRNRDGEWESPRNLQDVMPRGVSVNTPANEFRPSLLRLTLRQPSSNERYHDWQVLVFSSDRPGGQGGYDLYLTALPYGWETE